MSQERVAVNTDGKVDKTIDGSRIRLTVGSEAYKAEVDRQAAIVDAAQKKIKVAKEAEAEAMKIIEAIFASMDRPTNKKTGKKVCTLYAEGNDYQFKAEYKTAITVNDIPEGKTQQDIFAEIQTADKDVISVSLGMKSEIMDTENKKVAALLKTYGIKKDEKLKVSGKVEKVTNTK